MARSGVRPRPRAARDQLDLVLAERRLSSVSACSRRARPPPPAASAHKVGTTVIAAS
jgi:hypothetical protein